MYNVESGLPSLVESATLISDALKEYFDGILSDELQQALFISFAFDYDVDTGHYKSQLGGKLFFPIDYTDQYGERWRDVEFSVKMFFNIRVSEDDAVVHPQTLGIQMRLSGETNGGLTTADRYSADMDESVLRWFGTFFDSDEPIDPKAFAHQFSVRQWRKL